MVTVGMNYQVLPGKGEVFEKAFASVLQVMKDLDGHAESHLFKDVEDPNSYLIVSDWESRDAFNEFIHSERFAKVTNWGAEQILAGRPRHEVYEK